MMDGLDEHNGNGMIQVFDPTDRPERIPPELMGMDFEEMLLYYQCLEKGFLHTAAAIARIAGEKD